MAGDDDNIIRLPQIGQLDDLDAELEKLHAGRRQLGHYTLAGRTPVKVETLKAWVEEVARRGRIAAETGSTRGGSTSPRSARSKSRPCFSGSITIICGAGRRSCSRP